MPLSLDIREIRSGDPKVVSFAERGIWHAIGKDLHGKPSASLTISQRVNHLTVDASTNQLVICRPRDAAPRPKLRGKHAILNDATLSAVESLS